MKQLAILKYTIMFDPSQSWSSGSQFENQLGEFFREKGFEAQIIETKGGTGERAIFLEKITTMEKVARELNPDESKTSNATNQIKQVQNQVPNKKFKQFKNSRHVQINQPKPTFQVGKTNRMKVRYG